MGGDLVFLSLVIFDRVAAVLRTAYQNKYCSLGLGAGASTSTKNHPLSGMENRWFCKSGYQLALLARLQISKPCFYKTSTIGVVLLRIRKRTQELRLKDRFFQSLAQQLIIYVVGFIISLSDASDKCLHIGFYLLRKFYSFIGRQQHQQMVNIPIVLADMFGMTFFTLFTAG